MKLFDKLKDLFMDEIPDDEEFELEEEEKEEYKPPKEVLPKVMRETIEKEEKIELEKKMPEFKPKEMVKEETPAKKFSFPIDFEDDLPSRNNRNINSHVSSDVRMENLKKEKEKFEKERLEREKLEKQRSVKVEKNPEPVKKVSELYPKKEVVKEKPKFKATPVISPVYGILDKNYKKEEVKEKSEDNFEMKRPSKKVDFETVRKKAFGNLVDDIKDNLMCENCELYREVKKISALKEDDLLYDMTVDSEEKEVTIEKAYDNYEEFGVAYEPKINDNNKKIKEEIVLEDPSIEIPKVVEDIVEEVREDKIEIKKFDDKVEDEVVDSSEEMLVKVPSREEKKKETKVDADFFELIDSMYKERVDD